MGLPDRPEGTPKADLPLNSERERLQRHEGAERRVSRRHAAELDVTGLLGEPGGALLDGVGDRPHPIHEVDEALAISTASDAIRSPSGVPSF